MSAQTAPSREEPLEAVQEFHVALNTDEMTRLKMTGGLLAFQTTREHLPDALRLLAHVMKEAAFPADEYEQLQRQVVTGLSSQLDNPEALSRDALANHFNTYPPGDPRHYLPLRERIDHLGSSVVRTDFVALDDESDEATLAEMLQQQIDSGIQMILLAGETAIMDSHDIVPRAVMRAGGRIESVGAPVDPGNLLMLAYINDVPVVGAPGCARSRKVNIVDWILPRLLAGDRLMRKDIVGLGHGGLLQDVPERGMPREVGKEDTGQHSESEQTTAIP